MTISPDEVLRRSRAMQSAYDLEIQALCDRIGYGNVMSSASRLWAEKCAAQNMPGSNFTVGPCAALTVPCKHLIRDQNDHCEICCGAGWTTRQVAALVDSH